MIEAVLDAALPLYDSARRPPAVIEELQEIWRYRDLVVQLVRRDLVARYKRSVLGVAWTMLNPLGTTLIMTIVFSQLFGRTPSYPAYVLCGLVPWHLFAQSTANAMRQIVWGGLLIHRIYVPKTAFVLSAVGVGLINLLFALIPVLGVMVATGVPIRSSIAFLPVAVLLLVAFATGVGLLLSTLAVYFADVAQMFDIIIMAWMYLTPVIYPESVLSGGYRSLLLALNPMSHLIHLFRQPLYGGAWPDPGRLGLAAAFSLVTLLVGWVVFTRHADEFAYRI